jgi:pimeloyl-ACP methyl ester carboxylesterase
MPICRHGAAELYYEEHGSGFPVLLIAPGGMRSAIALWARAPWNPVEQLALHYRVIVMDQRNAGRSRGPVTAADGWQTYLDDQLALLDHLQVQACHVGGMCIGGAFAMGLVQRAPERFTSAVLFQTIGLADNRAAFYEMYDGWAGELAPQRPEVTPAAWAALRHAMYDGDFLFTVDRAFVSRCPAPLLVLAGNDLYHPREISTEIARLAPEAELIEDWKAPEVQAAARAALEQFLARHTPAPRTGAR